MAKYYYHKRNILLLRLFTRLFGLTLFFLGLLGLGYVFFPLLSWQLYLSPAFAAQQIASPIPSKAIISSATLPSLLENSLNSLGQGNLSDAANWYPNYTPSINHQASGNHTFLLSIPSLGIRDAEVSNADNDLDKHLVNYAGTAFPPENGNAVVFGHSTLTQWFNPHDYKAIFATAQNMKIGDKIVATVQGADYTYVVDAITVVEADDTSPLQQQFDTSYLTIITCTPPGTTWKRLVIHSRLEKLNGIKG